MPFGLSFTNPWALALYPPLAAYFVWLATRSLVDLSTLRRRLALGFRLLVLALLVCALAGMQVVRYNQHLATMFVLDYSDSMAPDAKTRAVTFIREAVKTKRERDEVGIVVFGREAFIELAPSQAANISKIQTVTPSEFTDLAAAIRLGMASLPDGMQKRLVILSDGNENLGTALDEAYSATSNSVKVDVLPLSSPSKKEVLLERLTLPGEAKIGEPVELKVVARATGPTDAVIRLFRDKKLQGQRSVRLQAGKNVYVFPQIITKAGIASFEAQLDTSKEQDTSAENNRALGFVNVQGRPRVLLVSNEPDQTRFLLSALTREKVVAEVRPTAGMPQNLQEMQPYDAIILDNVPAWELNAKQMLSLQAYVRDLGCGLVMVGGDSSFGPGGYRSTPVEETLPVTMDIKQMQLIPGGAVAMIMHSCEFPEGNDWAKAICSQVTRQLGDNDWAGLVVFGMDATWVYRGGMLKVGPNRTSMLTDIRGINPGDMPDFDAALELAYKGLMKTNAYLKHVIILSDGDPSPPKPSLVQQFNKAKITISTIAIQPHDNSGNQSMWDIAKQHNGRFYAVKSPKEIPNIFLKEAATISRSAIIEETFTPIPAAESSILKGLASTPPLLGYVGTTAKPTAREILKSKQDDPVLATWQYGLGKSVAFTSDARQRWAAAWLPWTGYSKFWAQAVRWSMRGTTSGDLQTNVTIEKGRGHFILEAVDVKGNFLNFLAPKARLVTPDYKGQDLLLEQTGPGRYEGEFDARQLGTYLINVRTQRGTEIVSQVAGGVLPYSPEYGAVGSDEFLLSNLANRTGGDLLEIGAPGKVFTRPRETARRPIDIWLSLLMLAACLFPLDVAVRRLMWGETEVQRLGQQWPRWRWKKIAPTGTTKSQVAQSQPGEAPQPPPPSRGAQVPPAPQSDDAAEAELDSMERLRRAKKRARKAE